MNLFMTFSNYTLTGTEYLSEIYRRRFPDDSVTCWTTCVHAFVPRPLFLRQCCQFPTPGTASHHRQPSLPSMASIFTTTFPPWYQREFRHDDNLPPIYRRGLRAPPNNRRDRRDNDNEDIWGFHAPHAYACVFFLFLGVSMGLFFRFQ